MSKLSAILSNCTHHHINDGKKEVLFSELHSLLSSGLDFSHSFSLLISTEDNRHVAYILKQLYDCVIKGESLWQALEHSGHFTTLDCGVIRIGEQTGRLVESLNFLTNYYHKKLEQRRMVSSAISYPLVIMGTAIVVVIFMLMVIVPMFEQVYSRMGGELPSITRWIITFSKQLPLYTVVIGSIVITTAILLYIFRDSKSVRSGTSAMMLHIPLASDIIKKSHLSHFCKLLYLLTSAGVPLIYGIDMLHSIITFYPYQCSFRNICEGLSRGELFADNLEKHPELYDKKLTVLLRVGEEINRLPEMLNRQADELTKELEYHLRQLGTMLEPLLILVVGALVAVILISMYLPMFKLGGIMG